MLLAIDVGNTNTVIALFDNGELLRHWRLSTSPTRTADEYGLWLLQMMQHHQLDYKNIQHVIIATVVPETQFSLMMMCREYFDIAPMLVGAPGTHIPMPVLLARPADVGADRLVNAVEGYKRYATALIIVDFGTATTFDVVNSDGAYIGGVIAPGVNLSLTALHQAAAKLPRIRVREPEKCIGTDTISAMESGIYYGYAAMVDGIVQRIMQEMQQNGEHKIINVIATGGLASLYARHCINVNNVIHDLTLHGLHTIFSANSERKNTN